MIQASELRIGNWYNEYGIPKKVTAGFIQGLFRIQSFNKLAIDVSPIPLTHEILEKAGFRNYDNNKWDTDLMVIVKNGDGYLYLANQRHVNIFYLHQLQNLYFALTGEELQIEL